VHNQVVKLTHSLFWSNIWYWHFQAYFNYVVEHGIYLTICSFIARRCRSTYTGGVVVAGIVLHSFLVFQSGYSTRSTGRTFLLNWWRLGALLVSGEVVQVDSFLLLDISYCFGHFRTCPTQSYLKTLLQLLASDQWSFCHFLRAEKFCN